MGLFPSGIELIADSDISFGIDRIVLRSLANGKLRLANAAGTAGAALTIGNNQIQIRNFADTDRGDLTCQSANLATLLRFGTRGGINEVTLTTPVLCGDIVINRGFIDGTVG